jgi:hypothetical protein
VRRAGALRAGAFVRQQCNWPALRASCVFDAIGVRKRLFAHRVLIAQIADRVVIAQHAIELPFNYRAHICG